jgi:hypothetical protein
MNQSTKLQSCFTLAILPVIACLLSGCVHTSQRSVEVRGRVLDAETRLPIKGAKISFDEPPHHPAYTDANGRFRMKARTQLHWGGNAAGGSWPSPKTSLMGISHPDYFPISGYDRIHGSWGSDWSGHWGGDIGDVLLKPKPPSDR